MGKEDDEASCTENAQRKVGGQIEQTITTLVITARLEEPSWNENQYDGDEESDDGEG